ncbi:hypothetical protein BGW36DRAFT_360322 [Talaromyces proteolyticus]|uniref:Uncharacterized protein n=1 Tax=Talaromyces proteolyticus TaxID=1131652 RepID=A0AAD4KPR7_9EURO|nr:uncharacterized protein BGW36DRAFT_360322 [Talaromyces proteolyticus]KAH8696490.1 hypothetical protein BGW36DRAFT_360322 [Talaromyces proteolyticus]
MITGQMIVDRGLYILQSYFKVTCKRPPDGEEPGWIKPVLDFRDNMVMTQSITSRISLKEMHDKMGVIQEITNLFDSSWKFSMAGYFAALIGKLPEIEHYERHDEHVFFLFFRSKELSGLSASIFVSMNDL